MWFNRNRNIYSCRKESFGQSPRSSKQIDSNGWSILFAHGLVPSNQDALLFIGDNRILQPMYYRLTCQIRPKWPRKPGDSIAMAVRWHTFMVVSHDRCDFRVTNGYGRIDWRRINGCDGFIRSVLSRSCLATAARVEVILGWMAPMWTRFRIRLTNWSYSHGRGIQVP